MVFIIYQDLLFVQDTGTTSKPIAVKIVVKYMLKTLRDLTPKKLIWIKYVKARHI